MTKVIERESKETEVLTKFVNEVESKGVFTKDVYNPDWMGPLVQTYKDNDGVDIYEKQFKSHKSAGIDSALKVYLTERGFNRVESLSWTQDLLRTGTRNLQRNPTYIGKDKRGKRYIFRINKQEHSPIYFDFRKIKNTTKLERILTRLDPIKGFIDNRLIGTVFGVPLAYTFPYLETPYNIFAGIIVGNLLASLYSNIKDLVNWRTIDMPDKENKPITKLLEAFSSGNINNDNYKS